MATQNLSPIEQAYLTYFGLLGEVEAKKADEATAVSEATAYRIETEQIRDKAVATATRAFEKAETKAREVHDEAIQVIKSELEVAKAATRDAEKAVKDFQDRTKEELGYAPSLPQGAAPSGARRVNL